MPHVIERTSRIPAWHGVEYPEPIHLSIGQPAHVTWCGVRAFDGETVVSASASETTCLPCLREYLVRAWAPNTSAPRDTHCVTGCGSLVDNVGQQCSGCIQYACT